MTSKQTDRLGTAPEEGIKAPVATTTIADLTPLQGLPLIGSYQVVAGDRILVRSQTNKSENGIYRAASGVWSRATDWNKQNDAINGQLVVDANTQIIYQASFTGDYDVGVTLLEFISIPVILPPFSGNANLYLKTDGVLAFWAELHGVIDLADYVTTPGSASAQINTAAAAALASGKCLVSYDASVTYVLTTGIPIDFSGIRFGKIKSKIDTTNLDGIITTGCIIIGELAQIVGGEWEFGDIISSNPSAANEGTVYPQIRIQGTKAMRLKFHNVRYRQWYMDYTGGSPAAYTRSGNAYNNIIDVGRCPVDEVTSITVTGDPLWFNENTYWGGRAYKTLHRDNGYIHNHNSWKRTLYEGKVSEIRLETGSSNTFEDCRFEGIANTLEITGISKSNPAVVTAATNNYVAGDDIYIYNVGGMTEITPGWYTIGTVTSTTFELTGIDSSSFTTYTSGGFAIKPTVYFGADTYINTVERSWVSSLSAKEYTQDPFISNPTRDLGHSNDWYYTNKLKSNSIEMFNFSGEQVALSTGVVSGTDSSTSPNSALFSQPVERRNVGGSRGFVPSLLSSFFPNSFTGIAETPMIPVSNGDSFAFFVKASSGGVRFHAYCYDAAGVPLVVPPASQSSTLSAIDSNLWFSSSSITLYAADGAWSSTVDVDGSRLNTDSDIDPVMNCSIHNDAIKFIRFKCTTGNNSNTLLEYCSGVYYEPIKGNPGARAKLEKEYIDMYLTGEPSQGLSQRGMKVFTNSTEYECVFTHYTTLDGGLLPSAVSATVNEIVDGAPYDDRSVLNADIYGILLNDGTMAWGKVASLSTNTFDITSLVSPAGTSFSGNAAEDGAFVFFAKWQEIQGVPAGDKTNVSLGHQAATNAALTLTKSTCIGETAGIRVDGTQNTIVGRAAGKDVTGDSNTVLGANALALGLCSGDNNTGLGVNALANMSTGFNNTAVGTAVGGTITTGSANIVIGYNCEPSTVNATNQIVMGEGVDGTVNNQFSFGKASNIVSNVFATNALWSRTSDVRRKENIDDYELGLDFISRLRVVSYNWRNGYGDTTARINGLVAQEVEKALQGVPFDGHAIGDDEDKTQRLQIEAFVYPLINAIKELEARIKELEGG